MGRMVMTRQQAETICRQYQKLVGKPFGKNSFLKIDCVAVVPADDNYRYMFLLEYKECRQAAKAIKVYPGDKFEVWVITSIVSDKVELLTKDLSTYLREMNIEPSSEMFSARRSALDQKRG